MNPIIRFFKGTVIGALFAVPAVYTYHHQYYGVTVFLLVCAVVGGVLVDLEVI